MTVTHKFVYSAVVELDNYHILANVRKDIVYRVYTISKLAKI